MNDYKPTEYDDQLAQRLRREARRSRPAFSAALHERVMTAIEAASAPPAAATIPARRVQTLSWIMTAAASITLALALAFALNRSRTAAPELTARGGPVAPANGINEPLLGAASPAGSTLKESMAKKDAEDFDAATEELAISASGVGDWVRSAAGSSEWAGGQWGGLDRDAQRALATVAGPLPFDITFSLVSADGE